MTTKMNPDQALNVIAELLGNISVPDGYTGINGAIGTLSDALSTREALLVALQKFMAVYADYDIDPSEETGWLLDVQSERMVEAQYCESDLVEARDAVTQAQKVGEEEV